MPDTAEDKVARDETAAEDATEDDEAASIERPGDALLGAATKDGGATEEEDEAGALKEAGAGALKKLPNANGADPAFAAGSVMAAVSEALPP